LGLKNKLTIFINLLVFFMMNRCEKLMKACDYLLKAISQKMIGRACLGLVNQESLWEHQRLFLDWKITEVFTIKGTYFLHDG